VKHARQAARTRLEQELVVAEVALGRRRRHPGTAVRAGQETGLRGWRLERVDRAAAAAELLADRMAGDVVRSGRSQ
jgi:hypothetical protein